MLIIDSGFSNVYLSHFIPFLFWFFLEEDPFTVIILYVFWKFHNYLIHNSLFCQGTVTTILWLLDAHFYMKSAFILTKVSSSITGRVEVQYYDVYPSTIKMLFIQVQ